MSRERVKVVLFLLRDSDETRSIDQASFVRACGLTPAQVVAFDVTAKAPDESALSGAHAVIIGGSRWSVREDVPNFPALMAVVRAARARKIPIMGVCFGAQLIAQMFGGKVARDEAGAERGTFEVTSSDDSFADLLFADAPFSFPAQCSHHDRIVSLPPGAILLASSAQCPVHAFVIPGADVYGVQFHPERSKADFEALLALRGPGGDADAVRATLKETPEAEALLATFIDRVVLRG